MSVLFGNHWGLYLFLIISFLHGFLIHYDLSPLKEEFTSVRRVMRQTFASLPGSPLLTIFSFPSCFYYLEFLLPILLPVLSSPISHRFDDSLSFPGGRDMHNGKGIDLGLKTWIWIFVPLLDNYAGHLTFFGQKGGDTYIKYLIHSRMSKIVSAIINKGGYFIPEEATNLRDPSKHLFLASSPWSVTMTFSYFVQMLITMTSPYTLSLLKITLLLEFDFSTLFSQHNLL